MNAHVERIDTSQGRYYRITDPASGKEYLLPSVTHVLSSVLAKHHLDEWRLRTCTDYIRANLPAGQLVTAEVLESTLIAAAEQHRAIASQGMETGSAVHELLEKRILDGCAPPLDGKSAVVRRCFLSLNSWWEHQQVRPLHVERVVYSLTGQFAGTADLLGEAVQHGVVRRVLVDWKTTSSRTHIPAEYALQASSYARCCHEMDGVAVDDIYIVVVNKASGSLRVQYISPEEQARLYRVFRCVREVFGWQTGNRVPSECQRGRNASPQVRR